jgi:hypothetical protein
MRVHWQRTHCTPRPITVAVAEFPATGWLVMADDWDLHAQCTHIHDTLAAAQRAADDVLMTRHPHDCGPAGCGIWQWIPSPAGPPGEADEGHGEGTSNPRH